VQLVVATIGPAHGLRGEVAVEVRTDVPGERFTVGTSLVTEPDRGPLELVGVRNQGARWYLRFAGVDDRTAAESLRGIDLMIDAGPSDEADAWYPHELVGLSAELRDGTVVGEVAGVEHLPAQDALVIAEPDGTRTLVPFVSALVPTVDVAAGRVVLDPPAGLLASAAEAAEDEV
jgi:16S rRNA processing protein RimM